MRCHSTWPSPSARERSTTPSHSCSICLEAGDRLGRVGGARGRELDRDVLGRGRRARPCGRGPSGAPRRRRPPCREQQVLRDREAAEVTRRAGPTGTPSDGAGEAQAQVRAADPDVAGDGDLGAAADRRAVAGGDRRLREGGRAGRRGRRRAACGGPAPRRRGPRGRRRRRRGPGGRSRRSTSARTSSSSRALARWPSISSSICVLIALRAVGAVEAEDGDALGRPRRSSAHSSGRRTLAARPGARSRRPRPRSAPGRRRPAPRSGRGPRRRRSRDRSSRGGRRRRGRARSRRCPGRAAATSSRCGRRCRRRASSGSRRTEGRSRRRRRRCGRAAPAAGPARDRPSSPDSFMKVCGRSTATRGPPGRIRPVGQEAAELLLRLRQVPAPRELGHDLEADVVACLRVARAGVPQADHEDAVAHRRRRLPPRRAERRGGRCDTATPRRSRSRRRRRRLRPRPLRPRPRPRAPRSARRPRRRARPLPRPRARAPPRRAAG